MNSSLRDALNLHNCQGAVPLPKSFIISWTLTMRWPSKPQGHQGCRPFPKLLSSPCGPWACSSLMWSHYFSEPLEVKILWLTPLYRWGKWDFNKIILPQTSQARSDSDRCGIQPLSPSLDTPFPAEYPIFCSLCNITASMSFHYLRLQCSLLAPQTLGSGVRLKSSDPSLGSVPCDVRTITRVS